MNMRTGGSRRNWLLRAAIGASAPIAVFHLSATVDMVKSYTNSNLEEEPKQVAVILWYFSSIIFASVPIALVWSVRAPAERARPLQTYVGVLVGGLSVASFPVALIEYGPSGLLKLPQWLVGLILLVLIAGGRAPRTEPVASSVAP